MKPRSQNTLRLVVRSSSLLGLCTITLYALAVGQAMAQSTWTGLIDSDWDDAGNWDGGVPVNGTGLNFGGSVYGAPANFPTNNDLSGLIVGGINFNNTNVAGQTAVFTLGTLGQSITLGGNINNATVNTSPANTTVTDTINLNLVLDASRTITTNNTGTRHHSLNIFGLISEVGPGPFSLTKSGGATLGLANTANSFSGNITITAGSLIATSLQPSGVVSSIGKGSAINLSGGSLSVGNVGSTTAVAPSGSIDRAINFSNNGGINIDSGGTFTFTGTFTNTATGTPKTFTLGGSSGTSDFQGILADSAVALNFTKAGAGTWTLSGNNSYTGSTSINGGTLNISTFADTGSTNIGVGATLLRLGNAGDSGTLNYTGTAAVSTARQIQIGNGTLNFEQGGAGIRSNGDGILEFTNAVFNTPVDTGTGTGVNITTRTLTLGGANMGNNRIAGVIADNLQTETPIVALAKQDAGLWILEGANTYTGATTVAGGTLRVSKIADSGDSNLGNSGQLTLAGGTLSYSGATAATTARNVVLSANSTIDVASASGSLDISDGTSGGFVLTKTGSGILVLSGLADNNSLLLNASNGEVHLGKGTTAGIRAVAGITGIGSGATVKLIGPGTDQIFGGGAANQGVNGIVAGGTLDLNGKSESVSFLNGTGGVVDGAVTGGSGTTTFTVGEGNVTASFAGVIQNTTGTLNLTKTGSGTQTLGGANTYSGTTSVNGGKLVVTNSIGSSTVTVTGSGVTLASDTAATIGSTLTVNNGAILAVGDAGNAATATATVLGATTFNNGSIFSWDINETGTSYDKLVTTGLVDGNAAGGTVFRIVAGDSTFSDTFWSTNQTWNDIFTTNGSTAIANWATIFGTAVTVVDSSFVSITPSIGTFSISGSSLTWTAVPEPSSALAGLLVTAGLLRRRRA